MNLRRWLTVGIGVKRWLLVAFLGLLVLALGVAHVLRQVTAGAEPGGPVDVGHRRADPPVPAVPAARPGRRRGGPAACSSSAPTASCARSSTRSRCGTATSRWSRSSTRSGSSPAARAIVAIGGGTGLSTLLRGLKEHTSNLTAVVTVADDGGLVGRAAHRARHPGGRRHPQLHRRARGRRAADGPPAPVPVPGRRAGRRRRPDAGRRCRPGLPPTRGAEALSAGLGGHAVGNLLLAALVALEHGDFEEGVREMNRVLAVRGRVVPATGTRPHAARAPRRRDRGRGPEPDRAGQRRVDRVWVTPGGRARRPTTPLRAIAEAEIIVLGPGSLYTSILPALLVPGIREAIAASGALVVFACNVATQPGETGGYDLADHVDALERHGAAHLPDVVLANNRFNARAPAGWQGEPVRLRWPPGRRGSGRPRLVLDDLVDPVNAHHHDPDRLAGADHRGLGARGRASATAGRGARRAHVLIGADVRNRPGPRRGAARGAGGHRSVACLRPPGRDRRPRPAGPCARARGRAPRRPSRRPRRARVGRSVPPGVPAPRGRPGLGDGPRALPDWPGCAAGSSPAGR